MSNINRRDFGRLGAGLFSLFTIAKAGPTLAQETNSGGNDRSIPLDTSKTTVDLGFRHPNGLILFFEYDGYASQFGVSNPYFFPDQTDVNTASEGIKQSNSGIGYAGTRDSVTRYGGSFQTGTGLGEYDLEGNPKLNGLNHELDLICGSDMDNPSIGPDFDGASERQNPVALEPLTPQEMNILNQRLKDGEIKLFQSAPIYKRFDMYELPNGSILTLAYDWSDGVSDINKAFLFDPNTRRWQELNTTYHAPDARHTNMGAGWETNLGFLQFSPEISVRDALWYDRNGNDFVNPKPARLLNRDSALFKRTFDNLFQSPASRGLRTYVPNPCGSPSVT